MKKTYKNPEIEVIKLKMHQPLLDASARGYGSDVSNTDDADGRILEEEW